MISSKHFMMLFCSVANSAVVIGGLGMAMTRLTGVTRVTRVVARGVVGTRYAFERTTWLTPRGTIKYKKI